jgi:uncharacterized protein (TIGR02996 family)
VSSERDALMATIIADPADDTPRLVYADWLEEHGQEERAELIRVQCELSQQGDSEPTESASCRLNGTSAWRPKQTHIKRCRYCQWARDGTFTRRCALQHREQLLWEMRTAEDEWFFHLGAEFAGWRNIRSSDSNLWLMSGSPPMVIWRRGFPCEIRCPLAWWLEHGPAIVREHPIERVVITDREPQQDASLNSDRVGWNAPVNGDDLGDVDASCLPWPIFDELDDMTTGRVDAYNLGLAVYLARDDALNALSLACVAWARGQAGV